MSNLYVVARIRPLTPEESNENPRQYITIRKNELILFSGKHISSGTVADHRVQTRIFTLDHIFGSGESHSCELDSQSSIYNHIGKDAVESVKHGYNSSVFAYGMTGTGKTHTIFGSEMTGFCNMCNTENFHSVKLLLFENKKDPGLIPRVCEALLEHVKLNQSIHMKYELKISFVEIYNEKIHDLLTDSNSHESLRIREHPEDGPYVEGLTKLSLCDTKTLQTAINRSIKNRTIAANHVHEKSSRSHVICTIYYQEIRSGIDFPRTINSKLCLIDLAGSERVKNLNDRKRFTEGRKINLSLSSLSTVIGKLAEKSLTDNNDLELTLNSSHSTLNSARSSSTRRSNCYSTFHIPYRNSKLTWLLRDSLGGNARTTMIATISPSYKQYHETVNTLRYAQQAKMITNSPKVNEDESTIYIRQLLSEITVLKQRLQEKETYSTVHRFLNYYPRSIKRRPLLRKSSSESCVNQYPFAENFDTSQYSKEEIRHCESERYPKHTPDILTTSYSEYKQICDLQISQNDVKQQQQPITSDQTTQTNYSEEYGKLCVEYLQRSRIIDSSYCQLNSKFPFNDKSEYGDGCVTTHSRMRANQSNNLTNNLLNIHLSESNPPESKLFSNTKLTHQESQTDGENNNNSNEKDETTEKLILAKPLALVDTSYDNDDNGDNDDQMKKGEKHASTGDAHEASKELKNIRHTTTTTTTDLSGVKKSLSESILTSTPKKGTPSKKLRMKKVYFRRTHRGLPVLTDTMCKKSKSHRKLSPVKKVGKRRVYFADGMSVIINNMNSTGKQLINDCQFKDEKLQPNQQQVEIGSPVPSDEFTDSLELSTDLKVSHDQIENISMSINRTDDFSVERKLNDTADEMKLDFSLLMTPVSIALQDLSSPSSYRTTASYLDDRSGRDDIAVATGSDLLEVPGGQQEKRQIPCDSTDISLNLNDSLEAFESSDTNFDSTDSKEITKSAWFYPSVVEEIKEILQQRQSLSSPSSICSEDLYLDDHSSCDLNSDVELGYFYLISFSLNISTEVAKVESFINRLFITDDYRYFDDNN
ncbi:unnamed protein product [Trichobilharzia szidati]|nr:unnamed protein product [Trichobilharzia szidati]